MGRIATPTGAYVSPNSGGAGPPASIAGSGYKGDEQVKVTYKTGFTNPSSIAICAATATAYDTFSCSVSIPTSNAGASGVHKIKANGRSSQYTATTSFTLT